MPKLNVKQNNSNVIKAFQVALETGHRNLLDNPWWGSGEVVNQRGVSSETAPSFQYTIDRWKMNPSSSVTYSIGAGGITFTVPSAGYIQMIQYFLNPAILNGKTLTASVLLSNGTIQSGTISRTNGTAQIFFNTGSLAALLQTDNTFRVTAYATQTIRAVKLEIGSYSTLANDVPPDYDSEKRKCMAYFRRITVQDNGFIALGWATSATAAQFPNILGTSPMRAKPTATPTGTVYVRDPSGTDHAVSSFTVQYDPVTVCLQANTSGLTANTVARLRIGAGGRIDLSADL